MSAEDVENMRRPTYILLSEEILFSILISIVWIVLSIWTFCIIGFISIIFCFLSFEDSTFYWIDFDISSIAERDIIESYTIFILSFESCDSSTWIRRESDLGDSSLRKRSYRESDSIILSFSLSFVRDTSIRSICDFFVRSTCLCIDGLYLWSLR